MYEAKEPSFFKYVDENGNMKANAPDSAKKAFKAWKNDNPMRVSAKPKQPAKKKK